MQGDWQEMSMKGKSVKKAWDCEKNAILEENPKVSGDYSNKNSKKVLDILCGRSWKDEKWKFTTTASNNKKESLVNSNIAAEFDREENNYNFGKGGLDAEFEQGDNENSS